MNQSRPFKIIAIDGGAAVGKSSTAKGLAERLDMMHVDTGAHYRSLTHALLRAGADVSAPESTTAALAHLELETALVGRSAKLCIAGVVPTDAEIRSPEVNAAVSSFAAMPPLRTFLFEYQRNQANIARAKNFAGIIMEGRDIGSVIFPDADHRFFLHADEATRSARRAKEGQTDSIAARDQMDSRRKTAPLICPDGAIRIDTAPRSLEQVIETITRLIAPELL